MSKQLPCLKDVILPVYEPQAFVSLYVHQLRLLKQAISHSLLSLHLTYWALGSSRSCAVDLCMWCAGEPAGLCFGSIFCLTEPSFWQLSAWPALLSFVFRFVTSMLTLCVLHFTRAPSTLRSGECAINYVLSAKNVDYIVTKLASLLVAIVYKKYSWSPSAAMWASIIRSHICWIVWYLTSKWRLGDILHRDRLQLQSMGFILYSEYSVLILRSQR